MRFYVKVPFVFVLIIICIVSVYLYSNGYSIEDLIKILVGR